MTAADNKSRTDFLAGTGEMGIRIRDFDWAATPLGPMESWPNSLRTSVSLILGSRHPMWIGWGREMTFLYNDAYLHVLGPAKHPRALGRPASDVWAEIWDVCGPLADKVFEKGEATFVDDVRLFMNRGDFIEETFYSFSYSPIRDDSGNVCGLFCPSTDVTPKVLNARRLSTLSELAADAPIEKTTSGACAFTARILARNPNDIPFALLYQADAEGRRASLAQAIGAFGPDFVNWPSIDLEGGASRPPWPIAEVFRTAHRGAVTIENIDGLPRGVADQAVKEAVVLPVASRSDHQPYGVLVAGVNPCRPLDADHLTFFELIASQVATLIQNARAVEEEKKRGDMLAEIDRAKTVFFSNVSHEFRTPLTLMLGPLENLLAQSEGLRREEHEQIVIAHRNSLRLLKLVNSLLDFSRLEAGRLKASYRPTDLSALTTDLASNFRSTMEAAGLQLVVDCPPLAEPVYVDGEMWERMVLNLLSNAFKFTFEGRVAVRLRGSGNRAVLTVADTGIGIPEDELPRIFERFYRVEGAKGRTYEGTGIGLSLIQEYLKLHGGSIDATSRPGEGSTFTITLPFGTTHLSRESIGDSGQARLPAAARPEAFIGEAATWLPRSGSTVPDVTTGAMPRVLLADDNADMRDHVVRILSPDFEVITAKDGQEALDRIRETRPDLLISDVMMPAFDGFDLLHAVRADAQTRTLPVIFLSARAGEEMRVEGLEAGADDYLVKPFTASELRARVGTHLQLAKARRRAMEREAALRADAERARDQVVSILESITDGFMALDRDWRLTYVNGETERLTGMRREDMLGRIHWDLFPEAVGTAVHTEYTRAVTQRVPVEFENFYEPWKRWFHVKAYPATEGGLSVFYEDITQRKRAEEALRHQEMLREAEGRKWRGLFFQVPAAVALLRGPRHEFDACNDEYLKLVGRTSPGEVLGKALADVFPEIRAQGFIDALDRVYRTGEPYVAKEAHLQLEIGGALRDIYLNFVNLATRKDGEINGVFVHATDVTDLVRARKQVEESERRVSAAFAEAPIGMVLTTPDGRIVEVNQAYLDMLGYSREELLTRDSSSFTYPDDVEPTVRFYRRFQSEGINTALIEKRYIRKNGEILWARASATMRREIDGRPTQLIAIIEDITERKRAEEAIRHSEARFRQLADSMPQIVATARPDGCFDYLNERWYQFTGYDRSSQGDESWKAILHPDDLRAVTDTWYECVHNGQSFGLEYRLWDRDENRWRWFIGRALPVRGDDGRILKWIGTGTDIDEQKRVEDELRRANQDLEQFAYSASHDLQEPLRTIKIYGELLTNRFGARLQGQASEFLEYLRTGATRMEVLVGDLLAYTQVTRLDMPAEPTDANEALAAALASLSGAIAQSGASVTSDPLPALRIPGIHLQQLFQNLIGNAIKYRNPNRAPFVQVSGKEQKGSWIFSVRDNGIGIEAEYKEHIFGLFKRLHTADEYSGTGIGLAICQRIVERYHGRIWVESEPGKGSTFVFALPV